MSGFETRAIHDGQEPDPITGAVVPPISVSTTFIQDEVGVLKGGYDYARSGNPTRTALETQLASLEGAKHGFSFASGLAAEDCVLRQMPQGSHLIMGHDAYGGTFRLVDKVHAPQGLQYTPVNVHDLDALAAAWQDNTKMVWLETPTNPTLSIVDIEAVAAFAHERGALCIVDNTFASPYLQQPMSLGADVVIHSTTKYLGGHSDVVGGFVGVNDDELAKNIGFLQNAAGAVPGPMDCYLTLRGVKTLALRMERHSENAEAVVAMLSEHPAVETVLYPGLASHPGHDVATKQMKRYGGMVSFIVRGGEEAALKVAKSTKLFTLGESLGAVESLIEHPGRMTHAPVQLTPRWKSTPL